ncbi:biotin-dependent carboxyltransferase family protein [Methylobrevis pamukkalensis]|uniref:KipI antagonist n=1 Tax=Methylobrevis pamukkalensis TaxID=1439726 RepID=A0A1E3H9N6_9HYPH|nr:biotin-dependent carboxyltransferase family protein [Methylobrevis pamukkalensis]ODN72496.1 KipI antagonist [Methylobrevis pamukkalensis]
MSAARLTVVAAGPLTTVQDRGRRGFLHAGVSVSGPMDPAALDLANALVGNDADAAGLEFFGPGGRYRTDADRRIAVTGGDVDIRIAGRKVEPWESHLLPAGEDLVVGALRDAVWGTIAVSGGIDTPPVLGARATHLRTGVGGHEGRALQTGDVLPLGEAEAGPLLRLPAPYRREAGPLRLIPGPQDDLFSQETWDALLGADFTVSALRDRMATALDGPPLRAIAGHDIVSDGTPAGSIQVPGSGRPIVLMAERQTAGGYPKIATLASVDLPRLAQMPGGATVRFVTITREAAEDLLLAERRRLRDLMAGLVTAAAGPPTSEFLLSVNLVSGVTAGQG